MIIYLNVITYLNVSLVVLGLLVGIDRPPTAGHQSSGDDTCQLQRMVDTADSHYLLIPPGRWRLGTIFVPPEFTLDGGGEAYLSAVKSNPSYIERGSPDYFLGNGDNQPQIIFALPVDAPRLTMTDMSFDVWPAVIAANRQSLHAGAGCRDE